MEVFYICSDVASTSHMGLQGTLNVASVTKELDFNFIKKFLLLEFFLFIIKCKYNIYIICNNIIKYKIIIWNYYFSLT